MASLAPQWVDRGNKSPARSVCGIGECEQISLSGGRFSGDIEDIASAIEPHDRKLHTGLPNPVPARFGKSNSVALLLGMCRFLSQGEIWQVTTETAFFGGDRHRSSQLHISMD